MNKRQTRVTASFFAVMFVLSGGALFLLTGCGMLAPPVSPFLNRTGQTISVTLDSKATRPIAPTHLHDENMASGQIANWSAESSGKFCIGVKPLHPDMENLKRVEIDIDEIRGDRSAGNWRRFQHNPPIPENLAAELNNYCPKDFFITPRVRFPKLPPGAYAMNVRVYGGKNWDKQTILLTVRE